MAKNKPVYANASEDEKYKAENDVRTLLEAQEIRADKDRFKRAIKCAQQKYKDMGNVISEGK